MSNFYAAAGVLDELMLELINKGADIPRHVVDDLKSGRSFAGISSRQPNDMEVAAKAMTALQNAEMNLLSIAEAAFGAQYAEGWQLKIIEAGRQELSPAPAANNRSPGVPPGDRWVRIQTEYLAPVAQLDTLLADLSLTSRVQEDGYLLIHGGKENVSAFLAKIREIIGKKGDLT